MISPLEGEMSGRTEGGTKTATYIASGRTEVGTTTPTSMVSGA
jgi:hypothetical protein